MVQKMKEGPDGFVLLRRRAPRRWVPRSVSGFVLTLVISYIVAYVAGRTVAPGTDHMAVFRIVGTVRIPGTTRGRRPRRRSGGACPGPRW